MKKVKYSSWDLQTAAQKVAEGLPTYALEHVQTRLLLNTDELSDLVQISVRTLNRRRKDTKLPPDESERVYRINRLIEIAADVLGDETEARSWMKQPAYPLGGHRPIDMARTEPGARIVEQLLGRIEHGVPA